MEAQKPGEQERRLKTSAHVCLQCGFSINLRDLGLGGGATGLVTCPQCDWSEPIEIQIVDKEPDN
jgi:ssDNA-binding Zn-finger/Zn-ribbon topoisomerase 1